MVLQASEEELKSVLDGPAVYSNKFFVSIGAVVRITFSEQLPDLPPNFRSAVVLSSQDAIELKNLLQEMLAPIEEQLAGAESAQSRSTTKEK
jgi:hypothetical protein